MYTVPEVTAAGMSLVNSANIVGPSTDPCGIPYVTLAQSECFPLMAINCFLSLRLSFSYDNRPPFIPKLCCSLCISVVWGTPSKAF